MRASAPPPSPDATPEGPLLRRDGLYVLNLGSGSRGNCTWIGTGSSGVLVDAGVSARRVLAGLEAVGLGGAAIDAVLVTHEHTDHVGAAGPLSRALARRAGRPVPFLMTAGTAQGVPERCRPELVVPVDAGSAHRIAGLRVEAHRVPHDTPDPVAWAVEADGVRAAVITDLGHAPRQIARLAAGCDLLVLEFNHDETMLLDGPYPWPLKQRIKGRHGHLSNAAAAALLTDALRGSFGSSAPHTKDVRVREVLLAHLSEENNTPEHALRAAEAAVHAAGARVGLHLATQRSPTGPVHAPAPPAVRGSRAAARAQPTLFPLSSDAIH